MPEDDTQAIADARETRDLVIAAALRIALRAVEHVDRTEGIDVAGFEETYPAGGFSWKLSALYKREHSFVRVSGEPVADRNYVESAEELARVMGNQAASFDTQVPRAWVELAARAAEDPLS